MKDNDAMLFGIWLYENHWAVCNLDTDIKDLSRYKFRRQSTDLFSGETITEYSNIYELYLDFKIENQ